MNSRTLFNILSVVALLGVAAWLFVTYRVAPGLDLSKTTYTDLDGRPVDITSFDGTPRVVNVWATWCGTCLTEMPKLHAAHEALGPEGLEVICISDEPAATVRAYADQAGYDFVYLLADDVEPLGVKSYPTTWILDERDEVVIRRAGSVLPFDDLRFQDKLRDKAL